MVMTVMTGNCSIMTVMKGLRRKKTSCRLSVSTGDDGEEEKEK